MLSVIREGVKSVRNLYSIIYKVYTEAILALKKNSVIFAYIASRRLLPLILEHSGDIALGALVIVISLIILLTVTLL